MFEGYAEHYNANARLIILRALAEQTDYRLNDSLLLQVLNSFAINKGKGFLRAQLQWLQDEGSCVKIHEIGTAVIAELSATGLDHVEKRIVVPGVLRPSAVLS
ncbi:MAG: hypothetical protein AAF141_06000 [Pseudomonadota bacterium]